MRIWDIDPKFLCRSHLLGEHRELHAIWSIITQGKKGYSQHPETLRWKGKLAALYKRHTELVNEILARGYQHHSALDKKLAIGKIGQDIFIDDPVSQFEILSRKECDCLVR